MTSTEQRIAELQKQLDELKASLEKKEDALWVPNNNDDLYYYIDNAGYVFFDRFSSHPLDKDRLDFHNFFETRKQAERHEKRLRLYNKLWRLAEHLNGDWVPDLTKDRFYIVCDRVGDFRSVTNVQVFSIGLPSFKCESVAGKAISMLTDEEKEIFKNIYRP